MQWFVSVPGGVLGCPVLDRTGFTGSFKVLLEFACLGSGPRRRLRLAWTTVPDARRGERVHQVRDAKVGLLAASDDRRRIVAEESTYSDGTLVTMLTAVPGRHDSRLYQKWRLVRVGRPRRARWTAYVLAGQPEVSATTAGRA